MNRHFCKLRAWLILACVLGLIGGCHGLSGPGFSLGGGIDSSGLSGEIHIGFTPKQPDEAKPPE